MVYKVTYFDWRENCEKTIKLHSPVSLQRTVSTLQSNPGRYANVRVRETSKPRFNDVVIIVEA